MKNTVEGIGNTVHCRFFHVSCHVAKRVLSNRRKLQVVHREVVTMLLVHKDITINPMH